MKDFANDLGAHWNRGAGLIADCATALPGDTAADPVDVDDDGLDESEINHLLAAALVHWCRGFVRATREWPEAWGDALSHPDVAAPWSRLQAWADLEKPESLELIAPDEPPSSVTADSRRLPNAVLALMHVLHPPPPISLPPG